MNPTVKKWIPAAIALALAGAGYYWMGHRDNGPGEGFISGNGRIEATEVDVATKLPGRVQALLVDEGAFVKAGQPLARMDISSLQAQRAEAAARQAQAKNGVDTARAQVALRESDVRAAEAQVAARAAELDAGQRRLARSTTLEKEGASSSQELDDDRARVRGQQAALDAAKAQVAAAQSTLAAAQAAVSAASEQRASNEALTDGTPVEQRPSVLAAAAKLREAWLAVHRTALPAPVSGYVGKRTVQLGQRVAAGAPLLTVVPLHEVWVDANFKENQLRRIRIGQPVRLTADAYGGKVVYDGKVSGLGIATGAASALLPAQNATGNWIKVVQRVPVRITLDPAQLKDHPLRVGLSMEARVDVADQSGPELAGVARHEPLAQTQVYADTDAGAEQRVRQIIERNLGHRLAKDS